ncbi:sag-related sequence srs57 [Cystoisospora suis]|uniref:Sag-related sequence srs57 n=1 Tax=Cystoisospora suis TaxID=483139 RepID=A0A2C6KGE0_9APIC|nr:sag-related sequence srs57 [Cystoisospora suis]
MAIVSSRHSAPPTVRGEVALVLSALVFFSLCLVATAQVSGQTATCGYTSTAIVGEITVSKSNNHFTLKCGEGAQTSPPDHTEAYCSGPNATTQDCGKTTWKALFPKYETKWWSGKLDSGLEMTIPKDRFPGAQQSFFLGCVKGQVTCSLKVIVEASAFTAAVGKLWIFSAIVGVAGGLHGIISV